MLTAISLGLAVFSAAAKDQLPPPDADKGGVAISIRAWSPYGADRLEAVKVMFVAVDEAGSAYSAPAFVESNWEGEHGKVFLLNASPGRYAAVAFRTRGGSLLAVRDKQWVFLEKPLIDASLVEVVPGRVSFAGTYTTGGTPWRAGAVDKDEEKLSAADSAQVHYLTLMFPDALNKSTFARIYGANPVYLGNYLPSRSAGRTPEAENEFWTKARRDKDLSAEWLAWAEPR
jgi:hypothetical protein